MASETVYMKLKRSVEVQSDDVFVSDLANIRCANEKIEASIKAIKVYKFHEKKTVRCVIGVLKIVELIEKACPGVSVECLGETDCLVERIHVNKHKGWEQWSKVVLVSLVSFFGTAFTIMAYHNDIGIVQVFDQMHLIIMGEEAEGLNVLELFYSLGLGLGIIVFFNHIGGRRLTKDPTPIEVSMRNYEEDVDKALIETSDREGKSIDVD